MFASLMQMCKVNAKPLTGCSGTAEPQPPVPCTTRQAEAFEAATQQKREAFRVALNHGIWKIQRGPDSSTAPLNKPMLGISCCCEAWQQCLGGISDMRSGWPWRKRRRLIAQRRVMGVTGSSKKCDVAKNLQTQKP